MGNNTIEMDNLNPGEYIIDNKGNVHIVANKVSMEDLVFTCPFCWSKYKKDGSPYKNAKRLQHCHGSERCINNRITTRSAHCNRRDTDESYQFIIYVTD